MCPVWWGMDMPVCACVNVVYVHLYVYACGGQRITCREQFSPSTLWAAEMELRSSVLMANAFTHSLWASFPPSFVSLHFFVSLCFFVSFYFISDMLLQYSPGWPETHRDQPALVSPVLGRRPASSITPFLCILLFEAVPLTNPGLTHSSRQELS